MKYLDGICEEMEDNGPKVEATSQGIVVVGQTIEFYGNNFLKTSEGSSRLLFSGQFTDQFGRVTPVDLGVTPFFGGKELGEDFKGVEVDNSKKLWSSCFYLVVK